MAPRSSSGCSSHWRSRRAPIGVTVSSSTPKSELRTVPSLASSSSSVRTAVSSSVRQSAGRRRCSAHQVAEPIALRGAHVGERRGRRRQPRREIPHPEDLERRHIEVAAKLRHGAPAAPESGIGKRQGGARGLQSRQQLRRRPQRAPAGRPRPGGAAARRPARRLRRGRPRPPRTRRWRRRAGRRRSRRRCGPAPEEVVRRAGEVGRVGERAGRDHPHDVAPQELLALAGALELLADRDLLAGLDQPGDVAVRRVVRNAGHRRALARGQRDRQQARAQLGVLEEQLVEVAEAEQQQVVGEPALQLPVLRHHRRGRDVSHRGVPARAPRSARASPAAPACRPAR